MSTKRKGDPGAGFDLALPPPPPRSAVAESDLARFVGDATPAPPPAAPPGRSRAEPAAAPPPPPAARVEATPTPPPAKARRAAAAPEPAADDAPRGGRRVRVRKTDGVPMRRTTVWMKADLAKRLALFCADREASQTDVIDAAVQAYLGRHGGLAA